MWKRLVARRRRKGEGGRGRERGREEEEGGVRENISRNREARTQNAGTGWRRCVFSRYAVRRGPVVVSEMKITEMRAVKENDDGVDEEEADHRGVAVDDREDEEDEEEEERSVVVEWSTGRRGWRKRGRADTGRPSFSRRATHYWGCFQVCGRMLHLC